MTLTFRSDVTILILQDPVYKVKTREWRKDLRNESLYKY